MFLIFIWILVQDGIRKLVPGQPPEVMLIGDFIVLMVYVAFFASVGALCYKSRMLVNLPILAAGGFFLVVCFFTMFYANPPSIFTLGLGFRSYFWYIPLAFLGYYTFGDEEEMKKFCRVLAYTSIPLLIIALFQMSFGQTISSPLMQPFQGGDEYHSYGSTEKYMPLIHRMYGSPEKYMPLIPSVFGSHSRYSRISLLLFMLGVGVMDSSNRNGRRLGVLAVASVICAAMGVMISGQRAAMYLLILGFLWFTFALYRQGNTAGKQRQDLAQLWGVWIASGLGVGAILLLLPEVRTWFLTGVFDVVERLKWTVGDVGLAVERGGFVGTGFGIASQGIVYIAEKIPALGLETEIGIESGIGKLVLEIGIMGAIAFYLFMGTVFVQCWRQAFLQITPFAQRITTAVYVYFGCLLLWFSLFHHQVLGDGSTLIPLWFFLGVVFRLKTLPTGAEAHFATHYSARS